MAFTSCIGRRVARFGCKVIGWQTPRCPQGGRESSHMELPAELRRAIDKAVEGIPSRELERAVESLSARYRAELCGRHVDDDVSALAYLAARLPATYAAIRSSLDSIADMRPAFSPQSLLDVGAGPGTALWA